MFGFVNASSGLRPPLGLARTAPRDAAQPSGRSKSMMSCVADLLLRPARGTRPSPRRSRSPPRSWRCSRSREVDHVAPGPVFTSTSQSSACGVTMVGSSAPRIRSSRHRPPSRPRRATRGPRPASDESHATTLISIGRPDAVSWSASLNCSAISGSRPSRIGWLFDQCTMTSGSSCVVTAARTRERADERDDQDPDDEGEALHRRSLLALVARDPRRGRQPPGQLR